ncbi:uncharacterized protein PV07_12737, partial [Cladophialophora immunda]
MDDQISRYEKALTKIHSLTSNDKAPQPFHFDPNLFPHVQDAKEQGDILQEKSRLHNECRSYLVALPSLKIRGTFHVVSIFHFYSSDVHIKYGDCYPEGYDDPHNKILWKDEALAHADKYAVNWQPTSWAAFGVVYLVGDDGLPLNQHVFVGQTVEPQNVASVEDWDTAVVHVGTTAIEGKEIQARAPSRVQYACFACSKCAGPINDQVCDICHHRFPYPQHSCPRQPLPPKISKAFAELGWAWAVRTQYHYSGPLRKNHTEYVYAVLQYKYCRSPEAGAELVHQFVFRDDTRGAYHVVAEVVANLVEEGLLGSFSDIEMKRRILWTALYLKLSELHTDSDVPGFSLYLNRLVRTEQCDINFSATDNLAISRELLRAYGGGSSKTAVRTMDSFRRTDRPLQSFLQQLVVEITPAEINKIYNTQETGSSYDTLLSAAVRLAGLDELDGLVTSLCEKGAYPDLSWPGMSPPIQHTILRDSISTAQRLVTHGASLMLPIYGDYVTYPLHLAAELGRHHFVKFFLTESKVRSMVDRLDGNGETALITAIKSWPSADATRKDDYLMVIRHLLDAGADPDVALSEAQFDPALFKLLCDYNPKAETCTATLEKLLCQYTDNVDDLRAIISLLCGCGAKLPVSWPAEPRFSWVEQLLSEQDEEALRSGCDDLRSQLPGLRSHTIWPYSNVPRQVLDYIKRPETLTTIESLFNNWKDSGSRVVALAAVGGQGKSQLAISYCSKWRKSYQGFLWIDASSRTSAESSVSRIVAEIDQSISKRLSNHHQRVHFIQNTFEDLKRPWMLVLDHWEDIEAVDLGLLEG